MKNGWRSGRGNTSSPYILRLRLPDLKLNILLDMLEKIEGIFIFC